MKIIKRRRSIIFQVAIMFVVCILLPQGDILPVRILVENSGEEEKTTVTISYSGAGFDPADGENKLAYEMLKKTVADISYKYDSEAELPNSVTVLI